MIKALSSFAKKIADSLPVISLVYFAIAYVYMQAYYIPFHIWVSDYYEYIDIFLPVVFPLLLVSFFIAYLVFSADAERIKNAKTIGQMTITKAAKQQWPNNKLIRKLDSRLTLSDNGEQRVRLSIHLLLSAVFFITTAVLVYRLKQFTPLILVFFCIAAYLFPVRWILTSREQASLQRTYIIM